MHSGGQAAAQPYIWLAIGASSSTRVLRDNAYQLGAAAILEPGAPE